jgi:hypothetical protein
MGHQPNHLHYPPPNRRGHTGTGVSSAETSFQDSLSSECEAGFRLQREVNATSISEKFSLLSRTPSNESTTILQTKRCYSMHIVRGKMANAMKVKERQRRDPTHRPPLNRESLFSSASSSPDLKLVPRPQWIKDSQSDMSDEEADEIWRLSNARMFGEGKHLSTSMPNVSSFTGGNTLKVVAEIQHTGGMQHVNLALDTQSDVTTCLRAYLTNIKSIVPDEVNGIGRSSIFAKEGILQVYMN